jgi:hypothetical protein
LLTDDPKRFIISQNNYGKILEVIKKVGFDIPILDFNGTEIKSLEEQYSKIEKIKKLSMDYYGNKQII